MDKPKYEAITPGPVFFTHCYTCGKRVIVGDSGSDIGPAKAYADLECPDFTYKCISCVRREMSNFLSSEVSENEAAKKN